jgi:hypothetical protein
VKNAMPSTRRGVRHMAAAAALCCAVPALSATVLGTVLLDSGQPAAGGRRRSYLCN